MLHNAALGLPRRERARLALRLLESLDTGKDEDVDEIRLADAERRLNAYDAGAADALEIDDALAEIERQLT